jgi:hypothetical protein
MRCEEEASSDGGESVSKKYKRGYSGAKSGVSLSLLFAVVWYQAVGFVHLAGIFSSQEHVSTFN